MTGHITGTVGKSSDDHLMVMSGSGRTKVNIGDDVTYRVIMRAVSLILLRGTGF
ncbi:MAG: hypothetical protein CM1200mP15_00760 [Dehalococcoidia bacterium]|nr:MAG: hypothetical protein CM1200mP15_00760 [Dehalococcoidia bacterium]